MMPMHSRQNFLTLGAKYYGLMAAFNGLTVMLFTPFITKMSQNTKHIRKMICTMNAVLPIIYGMGYTLGPITMRKTLGYISIEIAWLLLGMVAIISSIFMYELERYDGKEKRKKEASIANSTKGL